MAIADRNSMPGILIAGCGKLGGAIASMLTESAHVYGLRRNPAKVPEGVTGIGADLTRPETLTGKLPDNLETVIYCLTPSSYDEQGYRDAYVNGLKNLLEAIGNQPLKRLFFISSTSVYAQNDDSLVDETSPASPSRVTGQQILAGEQTALNSGHPATVIRFSGIYGPSRGRFLEEVIEGRMNPTKPAPFSNRIHEDDAAAAVVFLNQLALSGKSLDTCYVASDCEPVRLDEVVDWVRQQVPCAEPVADARKGGRAGSKRCNNQRLLQTGFTFRYPDFRAGYRDMIDNA
ncbi:MULTISPECIES: NAD-dependent epimerase/dehydratase family protein [Marinobacter]|uniref:NAD-dependent epimerase/dehydratase family protein n=1 Tax=Marinobacter xiaoshiensis TaxID=3073652 RepID=A0ABU2HBW9_9GAMM|nr:MULTISPECIES: NAD-dependent epimerase/dehydratase family protein [unclassified Marinobacter]MBK1874091.1 NAD-dependent epimerase/dehydratase family protein [Marinobacter sp. 1-3A]MBK1888051.1 NAD-dependent epimerase/dehydratase family protein [Marinobacter sp. DY40_1A1]MDS1308519.1 NAD-dependent epimerase/dehydratase family protein [Marinobacter sp. F60267]